MPFYPESVLEDLLSHASEIRAFAREDESVVTEYADALRDALAESSWESLRSELGPGRYPGALPTAEWDAAESPIVGFEDGGKWTNHEAVNAFAKEVLEGVTTVGADGSELGPIDEFDVPFGLVQVAWSANHHDPKGDYEQDVTTRILGPQAVTVESDEQDGVRYPDGQAPGHERYLEEGATVVECIERFADRDPPPVVFYDGPLVPTFANTYGPEVRDTYYRSVMARVLAASTYHEVPVVGYSAGSSRTNVAKLLRRTYRDRLKDVPYVADARILDRFTERWGDRSLTFVHRQDGTIDALEASYRENTYEFATDVLFTYLDVSEGNGMDYLEFPAWIQRENLVDYVLDVVRAETGIGRGYPEIIQQADANAVLDASARRQFVRLVQEFAEEENLPMEWNAKTLSKERRRR